MTICEQDFCQQWLTKDFNLVQLDKLFHNGPQNFY